RVDKAARDYKALVAHLPTEPARILLIGPKNSVGTDLKGVTHVILLEPAWYEGHTIQHIGRAIRKNALSMITNTALWDEHTQSPFVQVYRMIAVRKKGIPVIDGKGWEDYLREWAISVTDVFKTRTSRLPGVTSDQLAIARSKALDRQVKDYLESLKPAVASMPYCK
ncbi:MAG: hypothetical protein EOP45_21700, partial [Sphingobacteriaceae bacterium]